MLNVLTFIDRTTHAGIAMKSFLSHFTLPLMALFLFSWGTVVELSAQQTESPSWTRFRGNQADGIGKDHAGLPSQWSAEQNVQWQVDVPGWGWSCPIVTNGRVYLTSVVGDEENTAPTKGLYLGEGVRDPAKGIHHWMVYCYDLNTGEKIWQREAKTGRPSIPRHPKSSYAAETATTDGQRLYVLFGDVGLYCYDLDGKPLWSKEIEPKKTLSDWGAASSPVVHNGRVFVLYDNMESSWIAAFDAKTGKEIWKTKRKEYGTWATPFIWENKLRTEIVVAGKNRNRGYSLDGKQLWEFDGKMSNLVIPSPFAAHGLCYIASGYVGDAQRPTIAIRPGAEGDLTPEEDGDLSDNQYIEWFQPRVAPYNTTQLVYGDYLYTLFDQGFFSCHDARTGEEIYGKQRLKPRGSFTASPWAYNGKIFCLSEDGLTYVIQPGSEFKILGTHALDELCLATPSIVGDKLLIRTVSKLYCLSNRDE